MKQTVRKTKLLLFSVSDTLVDWFKHESKDVIL